MQRNYPPVIEFQNKKWHFDTVAPITGDGIYKRVDEKTQRVFHALLINQEG